MASKKQNSDLKKVLLIILVIALPIFIYALFSSTSGGLNYAAKPAIYGSIALANPEAQLSYGDSVSFVTNVTGKLNPNAFVHLYVSCSQGGKIVYQSSSRDLNYSFLLQDQTGDNLDWNGEAASCGGWLVYRLYQGKNHTIEYLDSVKFEVAGQQ